MAQPPATLVLNAGRALGLRRPTTLMLMLPLLLLLFLLLLAVALLAVSDLRLAISALGLTGAVK